MQKLTIKQQKFIESYIVSGNATQAAIEAGYSKKTAGQTGNENLKKPDILKALEKRTEEIRDEKIVDQREIMEFISATQRGEVREVVVTPSGTKVEVPAKISDRLKAAELMGKRYAMWTEKRDVTATVGPVQITDDIPAGSDEDG
ncbi:terminase small subunit [Levilactobacillus yiduensis]|uniref:terminase small subunit n=1 Tax=Levilactobacillus yiduensis TaxID=2953880 RepID=UPI0021586F40|nr:terminase small subunit [Levilactobacillus yiduensis]